MENSLDVVILAAGKGTRMRSQRPKVLHPILGLPLLEYVLRTVRVLSPRRVVAVVGHGADEVREAFAGRDIVFVDQGESLGTGNALRRAREAVRAPRLLVLPGDVPLVPPEALEMLVREHTSREAILSVLTFSPEDPGGHGRVVRDEAGIPRAVVAGTDAPPEVVAGIYCMENAPELWDALEACSRASAQGEYDLADLVAALYPRTYALRWDNPADLMGVDTRADLARAEWLLRRRIVGRLQEAGVTVVDPHTAYIGPDVVVGEDTVLHPGVFLYGRTEIAAACEIGPQAYLVDSTVESGARVWFSVLEGAHVGAGARIGPYAHLRPGARIGRGARIGNFVEVKNAEIGEGVRAGHLAYIGDAEVGADANIGAGTITCNYDGIRKHRTVIGKGAFIGSNTALVAPVTVGEGAIVGAGSVITEDVPPYALALGRSRQVIKPDWAKKKGGA